MDAPQVVAAGAQEKDRIVEAIMLAFAGDPFARWVYPEPWRYLAYCPEFTAAFAGRALDHGSAYQIDSFAGAALWLPPGVGPDDEALLDVIDRSTDPVRRPGVLDVMERMGELHPPEPHWYLPTIGVDPARQRSGYGSALMRHALERIDEEGAPAYLENTNPPNTPFYERHGFEVVGSIQVQGAPTVIRMLRRPR